MAVFVYRCSHCGREVLVRRPGPLSDEEVARRLREEMRGNKPGQPARPDAGMRLRDDIWVGVSGTRDYVPRDQIPERCPACRRETTLIEARKLE